MAFRGFRKTRWHRHFNVQTVWSYSLAIRHSLSVLISLCLLVFLLKLNIYQMCAAPPPPLLFCFHFYCCISVSFHPFLWFLFFLCRKFSIKMTTYTIVLVTYLMPQISVFNISLKIFLSFFISQSVCTVHYMSNFIVAFRVCLMLDQCKFITAHRMFYS